MDYVPRTNYTNLAIKLTKATNSEDRCYFYRYF